MNEEEKKAIESFKRYIIFQESTLDDYYKMDEEYYKDQIEQLELSIKLLKSVLNLLEKKDKQIEELKEIDEKRTWTVNNVIAEYIPDYELISLVNRYKDESFIPRVEVEKILNDRKK